jgi:hypothetical protein
MRLLVLALLLPGCAYHIGQGVVAGALDEVQGEGRSGGVGRTADVLLERQVVSELGHQLGQGLTRGATDIDPEQQAKLEATIDQLLDVAAKRTGKGLRTEVSPELREMVRKDLVGALTEGLNGPLGDSLEGTVDRVVAKAVDSLRNQLRDEELRIALSNLLRDSVFYAMQQDDATPSVGSTIEEALSQHVLDPVTRSADTVTGSVAGRVAQASQRTENTLRAVIGALIVTISVIAMLYFVRNRQVRRLQEQNEDAERGLRNLDAALGQLDASARDAVRAKMREYEALRTQPPATLEWPLRAEPRGDDYQRRH